MIILKILRTILNRLSFRLLNSEIGNDHVNLENLKALKDRFSSP